MSARISHCAKRNSASSVVVSRAPSRNVIGFEDCIRNSEECGNLGAHNKGTPCLIIQLPSAGKGANLALPSVRGFSSLSHWESPSRSLRVALAFYFPAGAGHEVLTAPEYKSVNLGRACPNEFVLICRRCQRSEGS